jgi:arsenate reductase
MSEALLERAAEGRHEARSAGTRPADHVHDNVIAVMRELDVDLSDRTPRLLTTDLAQWADVVVTMGCGDECPLIPGRRYIDWDLQDPSGLPVDHVRAIRDDIASRISDLIDSLDRKTF